MTKGIAIALALEAVVLAACLTVVADLAAHKRVERVGGVNIWNYRGPVAHQRQPREIRLVFVGGTRAFSWGVAASETVPASVGWMVRLATDRPGEPLRPIVSINLGQLAALPPSYAATIERFGYLEPDFICLFDDLGVAGATADDRRSAIRGWTGYTPALPLVLREKGEMLGLADSSARRAAGVVLASTGRIAGAIDRGLVRPIASPEPRAASDEALAYADDMMAAIDAARRHARGVIVVLAPAETAAQTRNWQAITGRLAGRRDLGTWLRLVDLSEVSELYDDGLRLDGWNFGAGGIAIEAAAITPAVLGLFDHFDRTF